MGRKKNETSEEIAEERIRQAAGTHAIRLDLSGLGLREVPESLGQLTALQGLYLGNNQLSALPESLGQLTALRWLDLGGNPLSTLPQWLGHFTALRTLYLFHNQLSALPESLGKLSALQTLYLHGNRLSNLPESLGQLTALQTLYLNNNQLSALPESLGQLNALRDLYLHDNPALGLPAELLGPTWEEVHGKQKTPASPKAILDYYFRSRQARPLNEAKLILVGRGGVGKSSLVDRLVHQRFEPHKKQTEGIQITPWPLKLNGEDVRLHVWDFGGQEIMHATHQFFLTERSLYLLVLNGREGGEDADADYWLRLIESFGGSSPVLVVLNKIKDHPFDLNRRALEQKYVGIREFAPSDCEDGTGIDALRCAIERETDRLEDLRVRFPVSWFTIKDRLAGMQKNFLRFDEYREECEQLGEREADAQERLAGHLHTLGIALNYRDDPRLHDTHVLNPHWVTNGVYRILNAPLLSQQQGQIEVSDLRAILDPQEYPIGMHPFLLDLMRKFELCFAFGDDQSGRYLIPELLDKQEPGETAEFVPEECLNFQYHYPMLPEGLIPRFIVRTHAMSKRLPRWRSGVILQFEGCRALVKGDVQERKVYVSVAGPARGRRNLLAIIRNDFERIHGDIKRLQPQAMVPVPNHPEVLVSYEKLLKFEQKGIPEFHEQAGDDVLTLSVRELLNGVDVERPRGREALLTREDGAVKLFISYAHQDEALRAELDAHLKLLQRIGLVQKWDDRLLKPGEEWRKGIDENLERADIILLLVSADFLNSDFCWQEEMERALKRHEAGEARVIPVIIRKAEWTQAKFAKLQALPREGTAVILWPDRDSAWTNVAEGIRRVAEEIRAKRSRALTPM